MKKWVLDKVAWVIKWGGMALGAAVGLWVLWVGAVWTWGETRPIEWLYCLGCLVLLLIAFVVVTGGLALLVGLYEWAWRRRKARVK